MVVMKHFQDLIDSIDKHTSFDLPLSKGNAFTIEFTNTDEIIDNKAIYKSKEPPLPFAVSEAFNADIKKWRRLTALDERCKAVYEITFDIEGSKFDFQPGDTIGIIPHNTKPDVELVINQLELQDVLDSNYVLNIDSGQKSAKIPTHIPIKSTVRHVLTNCVDLRGIVKKLFLLALSKHTKDVNEKKILEFLCSKEGSASYTTHILNKHTSVLDVFMLFKSCKPPVEVLFEHLPRLLPRPYSIVNRNEGNIINICFSVVNDGKRKGLTTGWLEELLLQDIETKMAILSLDECTKVPIYLRKSMNAFCLPDNHEKPLVLIGPGTGVSPFIGFLQEREFLKNKEQNMHFGDVCLFFGCRNSELDILYEDELKYFESKNVLTKLYTAFSQEDTDVRYVQDAISKNGEEVTKLIKQGAYVYVCGDINKIAAQVKQVLLQCLEKYDKKTNEDAENYLLNMQKEKRYLTDVWN